MAICLSDGMSATEIEARHGEVAGMYARYQADPEATLRSIGVAWGGVTAERVRQRFAQAGLSSRTIRQMSALRRARRIAGVKEDGSKRALLRDAWAEGVAAGEIARRLGVALVDMGVLVEDLVTEAEDGQRHAALARRRAAARPASRATASAAEILTEFTMHVRRAWAAQGRPPYLTGGQYTQVAKTDDSLPSLSTLISYCRWCEILERAELRCAPGVRRKGYWRISPETCWEGLRTIAAELNSPDCPPTRVVYAQHSTGRRELPCAATVARRLGGWDRIRAEWPGPPADGDPGHDEPVTVVA